MVTHVVLIQPKATASLGQIQAVIEQAQDLQNSIPGIQTVRAGKNVGHHQGGYTYGIIMQFESMERLEAYLPHPAHLAVAKELLQICDSLIEFDLPQ